MKSFFIAPLLSLSLFCFLPFLGTANAEDFVAPKLSGAVVDEVGLLAPAEKSQLEGSLRALSDSGAAQLVVLVTSSLQGLDIADYGIRVAEAWKIGFKGGEKGKDTNRDRGVIFIVAPKEREMRIEVGYGLEGEIPDVTASRILEDIVRPDFQAERYSQGIIAGATAISRLAAGDGSQVFPARRARRERSAGGRGDLLFVGLIILFVISRARRLFVGIPAAGVLGYVVGATFLPNAIMGTLSAVVLYGLLRLIPSTALHSRGGGGFGGFGGGGGFGGSGGGGFGGFGGGGGSFGGGGSSSRW